MGLQLKCLSKFLFGLAFGLGCGAFACQSEAPRVCVPNDAQLCNGPGGCKGAQACLLDGSGFSPCDCGRPEPMVSETMDAGISTVPAPLSPLSLVGAPCLMDEHCGPELTCWSGASRGRFGVPGGPARGYCTRACTSDPECAAIDPASGCLVNEPGESFCGRRCFTKDSYLGEAKCLNRPDLACTSQTVYDQALFDPVQRQEGVCLPMCGSDAECPGAFCDPLVGICVDMAPSGAPTGSPCTADTECIGRLCFDTPLGGVCTAACVFGATGCGYPAGEERLEAYCVAPWVRTPQGSEGVGDLGICGQLCDTPSDCSHPEASCDLMSDVPTGRAGICNYRAVQSATADAGTP